MGNKVALITDIHMGVRNDSELFSEYQKRFYENVFFPELEKRNINTVFNLGDTFDRRSHTNHVTLQRARDMLFSPMKEKNIHMYVIVGNHDCAHKNNNEVNSIDLLLNEYPITVVANKPITYNNFDNPIHFIPWINRENYDSIIEFIDSSESSLVLGHFDISGFSMHKGGLESEHGVNPNVFNKHKLVLSGHFHTQSKKGNIQYIGNPFEFTWSDLEDPRGFWVIDTKTLEMEFIENPERMFYRLVYSSESQPEVDGSITGKYVKVVVASKGDPYKFDLWLDSVHKLNPFDLQVTEIDSLYETEMSEDEIEEYSKSTDQLVSGYIESMELEPDAKEKVMKLITELYKESLVE